MWHFWQAIALDKGQFGLSVDNTVVNGLLVDNLIGNGFAGQQFDWRWVCRVTI
jgi:hypothetical protein